MSGRAVRIVCFGNRWQGDDGFGAHVFDRLQDAWTARDAPDVAEAGTAGLSALPLFEGCDKVIIVDALRTGAPAGTVQRLDATDVAVEDRRISLHGMGLGETLAVLPLVLGSDAPREVVVIGAEIAQIRRFTDRLSPAVRESIPRALSLIRWECILPPRAAPADTRSNAPFLRSAADDGS